MIDYEGNKIVWISAGSLNYSREHNEFILPYLKDLREGKYPLRHIETGYLGGNSNHRTTAPFETAADISIELDRRLAQTEEDRYVIENFYCDGWQAVKIAKYINKTEEEVWCKIDLVVSYISSGSCPRWLACKACGDFEKCEKECKFDRITYTYREWCRYINREKGRRENHEIL